MNLIQTRRAIRRYSNQPITRSQIEKILNAGRWAPSAHNRQPWRIAVLTAQADKVKLANAMGERLRADRTADGDRPDVIEQDVARSYARITGAPVVFVVCMSMIDMDSYPDKRRSQNEWVMAVQSTAMAAQNIWLAAHSLGMAMCWLCAPLFVPALVRNVLDLPSDWEPLGLMTLGYPAEERVKCRKPIQNSLLWFE